MSNTRFFAFAIAVLALIATPASAQDAFPVKPVQLLVPFPVGGTQDIINRRLAERFLAQWKQPVVVINRPGANGVVAWQSLLHSNPDGHSILSPAGQGLGYVHLMNSSITSTFVDDFAPIAAFASYPVVFLVDKDLPVTNMRELAAYATNHPAALSYGTTGVGSGGHLLFELFKSIAGVADDALPAVHYPGIAPEITALVGKQIRVAIMPLNPVAARQIDAGAIRALAVSSANRSPFRKDIPTVNEQGFPALAAKDYLSYWVLARTPPAIVQKLSDAVREATEDRDVRKRIEDLYLETEFLEGPALRKIFELRAAQFGPLIKKLNITAQ